MFEKIKELRSTPRGNAAFKLSLYLVFLVVVIVILMVGNKMSPTKSTNTSSKMNSSTSEKSNRTYYEKQEFLINGKYDFKYTIKKPLEEIFEGTYDAGKVDGYKESEEDLVRYSIEDGETFRIKFTSKEKYEDLYKGLDEKLFDLKELFTELNAIGPEVTRVDDKRIYTYKNPDDYEYIVTSSDEYILKIDIKSENAEYTFEFDY